MRGSVSVNDLLHLYGQEERNIINQIAKDNIEATREAKMPLL